MGLKTLCASTSAGLFRIALMPIDACKTILQARLRFCEYLQCCTTVSASSMNIVWCSSISKYAVGSFQRSSLQCLLLDVMLYVGRRALAS